MDEEKVENKEEELKEPEKPLSLVERATKEREILDKSLEEARLVVKKFNEMKAEQLLSGRATMGAARKKEEIDPVEYAKAALRGEILGKDK